MVGSPQGELRIFASESSRENLIFFKLGKRLSSTFLSNASADKSSKEIMIK